MVNDYSLPPNAAGDNDVDPEETSDMAEEIMNLDDTDVKTFHDCSIQTDPDPVYKECEQLGKELEKCQKDLHNARWNVNNIKDDDEKTNFYTGLPTFAVFLWLFNFLRPKAEKMVYWAGPAKTVYQERKRASTGSLTLMDKLFSVLARLRLGLFT
ncbi:uncharacterized protein LOC125655464 [Ostrea edulis]|uniref:uncharacterized protein LOC125655464 n=1 Tax=Ostrea edulis TaxID=37623 RepID=UPI0020946E21|nr:uncharacterized protein LOC125655464 [Ostrea edulis]